MSQTHCYYALNRKAVDRIANLTWNQYLKEFRWRCPPSQWKSIGGFFSFGLDRPRLPEAPTPHEIAPILNWKICDTIRRMSPQYFMLLELSYQMGRRSFVRADVEAERLENDSDALNICAIWAFLDGNIDDRTLWAVLSINEEWFSDLFDRWKLDMSEADRRRIKALRRRFGRPRPIFEWQTQGAVRDGHTVLHEEDTRRFARFVQLAWRENWSIYSDGNRLIRFRNLRLARRLHGASAAIMGNCLVQYYES